MKLKEALTKLKEGDEVEIIQKEGAITTLKGIVGEITPERFYLWQDERDGMKGDKNPESRGKKCSWCVHRDDAEITLINSKSIIMSLVKKFSDLFVQEPKKSFRNAGVTDSSDMLTEDGQKVFLSWLLSKNQDAFKTEVVDKITETSDEKKG
jgi:hypothetical protein